MMFNSSTNQAFDAYQTKTFFGSLDGLRFFCIFFVMWLHSPAYSVFSGEWPRLLTRGHTGVDFFFVLSGYLITTLLLREETRKGRISLSGFYKRRALRILPAYLLLLVAVSAYYIGLKGQTEYLQTIPYYLFFVANMLKEDIPLLSIAWSLAVEEQFYLIWPITLLVLAKWKPLRPILLIAFILFCLSGLSGWNAAVGIVPIETDIAIWGVHYRGFSAILMGALLGIALHNGKSFSALWQVAGSRWSPLIGFAVLLLLYQVLPQKLAGWPYLVLHITMAFITASLVVREDHFARPFMELSPIKRVGQISYGLYLYHLIGLHIATVLVQKLFGSNIIAAPYLTTLLMIAVAVGISELSFRFYEQPFLNLRHRKTAKP